MMQYLDQLVDILEKQTPAEYKKKKEEIPRAGLVT